MRLLTNENSVSMSEFKSLATFHHEWGARGVCTEENLSQMKLDLFPLQNYYLNYTQLLLELSAIQLITA